MYNVYNCIDIQFATRHLGLTACWAQELFAVYCIGPVPDNEKPVIRLPGYLASWSNRIPETRSAGKPDIQLMKNTC